MARFLLFLTLILTTLTNDCWAVTFYNYHLVPPFLTAERTGIIVDLTAYLKARGITGLNLESIPRARLDIILNKSDFSGAILLVNPAWFEDTSESKFLWSKVIFHDADFIVSPANRKIEYKKPETLTGLTVGFVRNYKYPMFDSLIQSGQIKRFDGNNEESNLKMVAEGRLDAVTSAKSAAQFFISQLKIKDRIYISKAPINQYERRILLSRDQAKLKEQLDAIISKMPLDPEWQVILKKYELE